LAKARLRVGSVPPDYSPCTSEKVVSRSPEIRPSEPALFAQALQASVWLSVQDEERAEDW
jgi:hypothetical protein